MAIGVAEESDLRELVPSEREVRNGNARPRAAHVAAAPVDRESLRSMLREALRQIDFRAVTANGPILSLLLLTYFSLVYQLDSAGVTLLLPEISKTMGTSTAVLIGTIGLIAMTELAISPLMGFVADRARRTTMLAVGAVISHASIALSGAAPSFPAFLGARSLGGAGDLVRQPVGFSLLTDYFPPQTRARVFAVLGIGGSLGTLAGPIVAGVVASNFGWRPTLIVFGSMAAVGSLSFFLLREPVRGAQDRLAAGADMETAMKEQRPVTWAEGWRAAWSVRTLRHFAFATPFITIVTLGLALLTPFFYAERFFLSPLARGLVVSVTAIPALFGLLFSGAVTDRILAYRPGRVLTMVAMLACIQAVGLLVLIYSPVLPLAIAVNMIPAFVGALIAPSINTVVSLVVPARIRGLGIQTIAPFGALGVPVPIFLAIYGASSGIQSAMLVLVPLLLVAAVIIGTGSSAAEQDIRAAMAASLADEAVRTARREGGSKLLVCRDVDVTYDGAQVLFGVDFDVREGELVALLGTNGAGKSSLLRAIAGIQQASNGAIFLDGDDITHLPPEDIARRGVVMLPGGHAVFPTLTVATNLDLATWLRRSEEADLVAQQRESLLERFPQLRLRLHTKAGDMSGGEQQMLGLSQALLMNPRLLLIDELSLGLAPQVVETLLQTLREISAQGTTIVIVEQSINVALQVAERAVFMEKGQVRFEGPVSELVRRPDVARSVFLAGAATATGLSTLGQRRLMGIEDSEALLTVEDVRLAYGGVQVLDGLSLHVAPHEVVGVVGPNGAGKTTVFDVVSGFARPESGGVHLAGVDVTRVGPDARARLGLARSYQNVHLFPALTVRENIAVSLERHLGSRNALLAAVWSPPARRMERRIERRVDNLIESLGLEAYADKFMQELSTGTRRIVDIACQLATQPKLLLLDEPSSGLAQAESEMLGPVIGRIVKETGCGVLVIEHDLGLVAAVSDRLVAMRLGRVMAEGTPKQVLDDPAVITAILGGASDAVISRSVQLTADTR
jgi:ABC-type branched-subunit amino acid transport system ATPase component/MFS family permease